MVHTFIYDNEYFALDVETGSVHIVDKAAHDAIAALAQTAQSGGDVRAQIVQSGDPVFAEIGALAREGLLFSQEAQELKQGDTNVGPGGPAETGLGGVIKAMCLHLAHDCNLRCDYCFAQGGAFAGRREMMSAATAKAAIDFLVEASGTRRNLEVDFFGGEPLMNFGVLKETVAYARGMEDKHGKHFRFTVTTNAYRITDEMIAYLDENMSNIVISIDGRPHVHDSHRVTVGGSGSYARVVQNAKKLTGNRDGEYYIRGTFTADNLDFANDVLHVADLGFAGVSIEPVVTTGSGAIEEKHLPAIFAEYERLGKEYVRRRKAQNGFTFFHFMVDLDAGPCRQKRIRGCGAGTEYVAVAPGGDIYPCHQFVGQQKYLMGSVFEKKLNEGIAQKFADCDIYHMEKCVGCWAKYYCSGGCAAANENISGDMYVPYDIGCAMQKKRLELAIGMAAAEQME